MSSPSLVASFHALTLALQPHADAARSGTAWGDATSVPLNGVHTPHIEAVRLSGLMANHMGLIDRLTRGEEVSLTEIASLHGRLVYIQGFLQQAQLADQPGFNGGTPERRLARVTGQLRPSMLPPSMRPEPLGVMVARPAETLEVPTKHVRCAILFTDFSQFSKQSKGAKSQYIIDRLNHYFEALIPIAQKMGGIVNKLVGDAIMAFWIDSSNNSLKAVQAALAMQEATRSIVEELTQEAMRKDEFRQKLQTRGQSLQDLSGADLLKLAREVDPLIPLMKVGINTGWVSYGRLGAKAPYYSEITVIGDAVNTAARMEAGCEPGQICISQATQADLPEGMFDLVDLGTLEAKNIGMVQAFGVVRENRLISLNGNGHKGSKAIHGRENEITMLREMFMGVSEESSPQFTMLMGAPGEGKSTIANHFLGMVKSGDFEINDVDIIYARGEDQPELEPYQVMADALRLRAGVDLGSNQEEGEKRKQRQIENEMKVRALVEAAFTGTSKDRDLASRVLGHFLSVPFENGSDQMKYLLKNHAELNTKMVEVFLDVLEGLSRRRPVVLVVDDMQWTDLGTRNLMHRALNHLRDSPIMMLGLRRLPATDPFPIDEPDWESGPFTGKIIDLNPLSEESLSSIIRDQLGTADNSETVSQILDRAANNPLFAREIAAAIRKGMALEEVPVTVQDLFQAQLTRFPEEHLDLLKKAAIVGREFSDTDLFALGISEPDHLLPAIIESGFIAKVGGSEGRYRFQHDLRRESVLRLMDEREKQAVHAAYGKQLIDSGSQDFAMIASHLRDGGMNDLAAEYFSSAAVEAAKVGDFRTSATFNERAYGLTSDPLSKMKALFGWDEGLFSDTRYVDELSLLDKFNDVLDEISSPDRELLAEVHYHRAQILTYNGRLDEAEDEISAGLALYTESTSSPIKCNLLTVLGKIYYSFRTDYTKTREVYAAQLAAAKITGDRYLQAMALYNVVRIELYTGKYSEALAAAREVSEAFKSLGNSKMYLSSLNAVGSISMMIGEYDRSLRVLPEAIKLSRKSVNGFYLDGLLVTYSEVLLAQQKYDEAIERLQEVLPFHKDRAPTAYTSSTHLFLAIAYAGKGLFTEALVAAEEGLKITQGLKDESEIAKALSVLAHVRLANGQITEAVAASEEAAKIFDKIGTINQFDERLLLTHIRVLIAAGRQRDAFIWAQRAKRIIEERARHITDEGERRSFLSQVPETRELMRLWQVLREESSAELSAPIKALLDHLDFHPPQEMPQEVQFVAAGKGERIVRSEREHSSAAGVTLNVPLASVLTTLMTRAVKIDKNPGEVEGVWAKDIHWEPLFSETGGIYSLVEWDVASKLGLHKIVFPLIGQQTHRQEILKGHAFSRDGVVYIELKRSRETVIKLSTGGVLNVDPDIRPRKFQFGDVRFILVPTHENKTTLVLEMGRGLYTQNPWNILKAFVSSIHESNGRNVG